MRKKSVHLPEELLIEILLRLPVKTVLGCKCVCKLWFSLISNPNFATSRFQLAANRLVCLGKYSETLTIDFNASFNHDSSYDFIFPDFEIGGSCRGFLFLHRGTDFYIWNPSTRVHKQIPASPVTIIPNSYLYTFLYGFGYNHSTDDYLIVLGSLASYYWVSWSIHLEILSFRANKWKQIELGSHLPYTIAKYVHDPRVGVLLDEAIHWIVYNHETSMDVIFAFDLNKMTISEIPLPDDFCATPCPKGYDLVVLDGHICALIVEMNTLKTWVMQKYAVHSSWIKTHEFSVDPVMYFSLSIVCLTNCGDIIVTDGRGGLMKFNDKGQMLEHHCCHKSINSTRSQMALYTESMFSLPCGN